ncbi:MAG: PAS domain-containing sensor histidine kinase [Desulfuromonas sp.]|nr:MAG: PAS domain-containing sensor histidine kinase [Desulfuromonas sp.]
MSQNASDTTSLYGMVLENIEDAVIALDQEGRINLFNPAAQTYTGISEKQSLGRLFSELFSHQQNLCYLAQTTLSEGRSISDHENVKLRGVSPRPVSATASPLLTADGQQQGAVLILRDLTQVRKLEAAVQRADQMAMVGTMSAGLAHEVKNPLGGIKGAAQLLQMELQDNSELGEYPRVMIREVDRINAIIEELLDLAKPRTPKIEPVNINQILDEIMLLQKQTLSEREIRFQLNLDPSIPPTLADRDLLIRLFLNLIKNAGEAAPVGGTIRVESRIDSEYQVNRSGSRAVPLILITIHDDGPGISAKELERIFTPFYTTKTGGSGLGLAICQKIVTDHGGFLKIMPHPVKGTSVKVSLPLIRKPAGHLSADT